jgi:hypothetical protein
MLYGFGVCETLPMSGELARRYNSRLEWLCGLLCALCAFVVQTIEIMAILADLGGFWHLGGEGICRRSPVVGRPEL